MVPNSTSTTLAANTTMPTFINSTVAGILNTTFLVPTFLSQEEFLALQLGNSSDANATTPSNETIVNQVVFKTWYPSEYSAAHIIIASVVVTVLMIMVVVGNMLVIIAIVTEKTLKNIQNWFIASLAVSDFFLGLVIMPFSLANELMGYWIFGFWWCEIHSAMDVLLCTASIMNLCLISLDRYWSITQAVDYLKKRTPARAAVMIAAVWLMSALVCIPPLLGWRVTRPPERFPQCKVSDDIGYVVYSALGSFYIPSCIMVFVYIRIYYAAKARARRGIRKKPKANEQQTSFSNPKGTRPMPATPSIPMPGGVDSNSNNRESQISTIESQQVQIPTVTCDFASDISTSEAGDPPPMEERKDTLKVVTSAQVTRNPLAACQHRSSTLSVNGELQLQQQNRCRAPSVAIDTDMVSEFDPSSSDSGVVSRCAVVKPLKLRICQPIFGKKADSSRRQQKQQPSKAELEPAIPKPHKPRDPEREKRRLARKKEKRATLILGLIMGSFIACWLPFFFLYILKAACHACEIPGSAFAIAFWLGYMNSVLNPVIYTIFNKDFRRAFRRILFK
ncbi:alpha-2A adrenergic receptor isoform X2 [Plutella xylostella]|uniref:alpha-2A adrenergic receptor isoform X2 n=1 Tax=Plutella xylostella TaxID=51655 RepID=UPI002032BE24|nr:alpha-2A adrenergic receptor isoform X2 [Plutella xylostella]